MANSAEQENRIKYCLDNYTNVAKYLYNMSLAYYIEYKENEKEKENAALLGKIYKIMCVNGQWVDDYIKKTLAIKKNLADKIDSL